VTDSLAAVLRDCLMRALLQDVRRGAKGPRTRRDRRRVRRFGSVSAAALEAALLREGVLRAPAAPETLTDAQREARALRAAAALPELASRVWHAMARDVEIRPSPTVEVDYDGRSSREDDQEAAAETARQRAIVTQDAVVDRVLTMLETGQADSVEGAARRLGVNPSTVWRRVRRLREQATG
jgi:hypothetical protein